MGATTRFWVFAMALVAEFLALLLDEPFAGLDEASSVVVTKLLAELRAQGRAVIVSTHQTAQVEPLGPDVLRLEGGRVA